MELFLPYFLSGIGGSGIGGNHATHHLFSAAARHLDMLDGERSLASKLRRLRIVAGCRCMLRSLRLKRDFGRRAC